jgi:hypothetical protein
MQFGNVKTPVPTRGKGGVATTGTAAAGRGPAGELTMYKEPPAGEVSVEEFEKYALDRLRGKQAQSRYLCTATLTTSSRGPEMMSGCMPQEARWQQTDNCALLGMFVNNSAQGD